MADTIKENDYVRLTNPEYLGGYVWTVSGFDQLGRAILKNGPSTIHHSPKDLKLNNPVSRPPADPVAMAIVNDLYTRGLVEGVPVQGDPLAQRTFRIKDAPTP